MNYLENTENRLNDYFVPKQLGIDDSNTYYKHWVEIMRDYPIALTKLKLRSPNSNLLAAQLMRKAIRLEVSEVVLPIAIKLLRYHTFQGNFNKAKDYEKIVVKYNEIVAAEQKADVWVSRINKDIIKKINSENAVKKIDVAIEALTKYKVNSYGFIIHYHELLSQKYQLLQDDEMVLKNCQSALNKLLSKRFKIANGIHVLFLAPTIPILLKEKNYKKADEAIKTCYQLLPKHKYNWFLVHSFDIISSFRQGNIDRVNKCLNQVKSYPSSLMEERYHLFASYAAIFSEKRLRVGRFLNNVYEMSKDKEGYNVAILIAEFIHLLKNGKRDQYINKIETTKEYVSRVMKSRQVSRSKYFLKMLLQVPASNFHQVLFEAKTKRVYQTMTKHQEIGSLEIELIGYEELYEVVKTYLKS